MALHFILGKHYELPHSNINPGDMQFNVVPWLRAARPSPVREAGCRGRSESSEGMMGIKFDAAVRVYHNITRHIYSVQEKGPKGWRVAGYNSALLLTDATFKVYQAGYKRYLLTGQKNVHAYVCGTYKGNTLVAVEDLVVFVDVVKVRYAGGKFIDDKTKQRLQSARNVWLTPQGVYAQGVTYALVG